MIDSNNIKAAKRMTLARVAPVLSVSPCSPIFPVSSLFRFFLSFLRFTCFLSSLPFLSFSQADTTGFPNYWSSDREYTYSAIYLDSVGEVITHEIITFRPTGEIWETDPRQTLAEFILDYSEADSAKLAPFPLNGIQKAWKRTYQEGVMQTPHKVWMHPLRANQYLLTEIAPFPEVYYPVQAGMSWNSSLWIFEAFGTYEGTVESEYVVYPQEERRYDFGFLKCWKIVATGTHDKLGKSIVIFYFNEDYGFTEMNYTFYNWQRIDLKMIDMHIDD